VPVVHEVSGPPTANHFPRRVSRVVVEARNATPNADLMRAGAAPVPHGIAPPPPIPPAVARGVRLTGEGPEPDAWDDESAPQPVVTPAMAAEARRQAAWLARPAVVAGYAGAAEAAEAAAAAAASAAAARASARAALVERQEREAAAEAAAVKQRQAAAEAMEAARMRAAEAAAAAVAAQAAADAEAAQRRKRDEAAVAAAQRHAVMAAVEAARVRVAESAAAQAAAEAAAAQQRQREEAAAAAARREREAEVCANTPRSISCRTDVEPHSRDNAWSTPGRSPSSLHWRARMPSVCVPRPCPPARLANSKRAGSSGAVFSSG
jgi:hypothetical protein